MWLCKFWDRGGRQSDKNLQQDKVNRMLQRLAISDNNSICFAVHKSSNFNCNLVSKIVNFMRSMLCSKKRKIIDEGRVFKDEWFVKYFAVQQNERALYLILICRNNIACLNELISSGTTIPGIQNNTREF